MGQYLAQTLNIEGELSRELVNDISLSERAHLAYQALSRGSCRFVDNGQARAMKGYVVEIDPEIETALSSVMPDLDELETGIPARDRLTNRDLDRESLAAPYWP
jgi:hypothetical protein